MKTKVTLLKGALAMIAVGAIFLTVILSIQVFAEGLTNRTTLIFYGSVVASVFFGLYVLYLLNAILNRIKEKQAFSEMTLLLVGKVKRMILVISVLFLGVLPFFYRAADRGDAPGIMVIGLVMTALPFIAYIFSQIVEALFKSAVLLKLDNELTI